MKKLLTIFCFSIAVVTKAQQPYWQQQVNHTINVSLTPATHSVKGFQQIQYTNNSPDSLAFIWFHIYPNAYKNDKTAFSNQLLKNNRTDFYFAHDSSRGYINQLSFMVDGKQLTTTPHPEHIDIIKVLLDKPLAPNSSITINNNFNVKLPYNFSRSGYVGNTYQVTQWYPKPAVYDAKGWHPMPYLDQGEFYYEFGNYDVTITVPKEYLVAATGVLQNAEQLEALKKLGKTPINKQKNFIAEPEKKVVKLFTPKKFQPKNKTKKTESELVKTSPKQQLTEFHFTQNNVTDFAWFASPKFLVAYDTLTLEDRVVDVFSFFPNERANNFAKSTQPAKAAIKFYSENVGIYPHQTATVVVGIQNKNDGMEYPTITYINTENDKQSPSDIIYHELGHNWFYGILANNERDYPWMDESINSFYEKKLEKQVQEKNKLANQVSSKKKFTLQPIDGLTVLRKTLIDIQKIVPTDTTSEAFSQELYGFLVYEYGAKLLQDLEQRLGKELFTKAMKAYYEEWKFKHPQPQEFIKSIEKSTGKNVASWYHQFKNLPDTPTKKTIKPAFILNLSNTHQYNYINIAPTPSFNLYDGLRLGVTIHNYQLPLPKFQFFANPSFGTSSSNFTYFGKASYNIYQKKYWLQAGVSLQHYNYDDFKSDAQQKVTMQVSRLVPSIKLTLYNAAKPTQRQIFGVQSFMMAQENLRFQNITTPIGTIENITTPKTYTTINRVYATWFDTRVLYPYNLNLTIDQGRDFVRAGFTAKQFFNYGKQEGGIEARFFAGKFFYIGGKTLLKQFRNDPYHLNLSGPKGYEDYTFSDYFIGRSEFEGWHSQQIMERDGFFKVRTDFLANKVGKTDDWLMALNLSGDIPDAINPLKNLPIKIPLQFFVDIGTYAEAWKDNPATGRFLYAAGLQLPVLKNAATIYIPILFSKVYRDYNQSILGEKHFLKTISFTINVNNLTMGRLRRDIPL